MSVFTYKRRCDALKKARAALERPIHVVERRRKTVGDTLESTYLGVMTYRQYKRLRDGTLVMYDARFVDCHDQQWLNFYGIKETVEKVS